MATVTGKRFKMVQPKSRFKMSKEELEGVSFQQLANWLKEDMELLFVGFTKKRMVNRLYAFYKSLGTKKETTAKPALRKSTTKRK